MRAHSIYCQDKQILHTHILYVTHHLSLLNVVYVDKYFLIKPI